jgi:phosphate transport system permease protein
MLLLLAAISASAFYLGRQRSLAVAGGPRKILNLHSLPGYYGYYTFIWALLPALALILAWLLVEPRVIVALTIKNLPDAQRSMSAGELDLLINNIKNFASGDIVAGQVDSVLDNAAHKLTQYHRNSRLLLGVFSVALAMLGGFLAWRRITPALRARNRVESIVSALLVAASSIAILTTIGIVLSVLFEAVRFFREVPVGEFLFGTNWSPQTAIRADQVGSSGSFGAVPLFTGTLLITFIAMVFAVPIGLMTAIYLAEYSSNRVRAITKPVLEILAGIPTVVYGFFAALTVAPAIRPLPPHPALSIVEQG